MLERLVREHLPATLRFAVRLTGDVDAAEEVVQDALVRATRSWNSFRSDAAFKTWLFQIVVNVFRARVARRRETREVQVDFPDVRAPDPAAVAEGREFAEIVARHVSSLPERQREVLVLTAYEGFSPTATAECLGVTEANVRVHLHLARNTLRRRLAAYLAEK
jgi:RNA polymerase sigma-70 factor (ECF subfamily)